MHIKFTPMKKSVFILFILLSALSVKMIAQDKRVTEICIPCEKLIELKLPDVKITSAITVTQGPSHCKVKGVIGKEINFELLLPLDWNGSYVMGCGGGFVGSVQNMAAGKVKEGSRPVYPYPKEAIYDGKGNPNSESSYKLKQ